MIWAQCIDRLRNKYGVIVAYKLQDRNGVILEIQSDELKKAISNGHVRVSNLILTSDGIPQNTLKKSKDVGQMIRRIRRLAKNDLLSINENKAVRNATLQRDKHYALDDASAIIIEVEYINERDEER